MDPAKASIPSPRRNAGAAARARAANSVSEHGGQRRANAACGLSGTARQCRRGAGDGAAPDAARACRDRARLYVLSSRLPQSRTWCVLRAEPCQCRGAGPRAGRAAATLTPDQRRRSLWR